MRGRLRLTTSYTTSRDLTDRDMRSAAEEGYSSTMARFLVDMRQLLDIPDLPEGVAQLDY